MSPNQNHDAVGQNRDRVTSKSRPSVASPSPETPSDSTGHLSKLVMIRGERHDEVLITDVLKRFREGPEIPTQATIVQRTVPYYGPKLMLHDTGRNYLLTAPGPNSQLHLWSSSLTEQGRRNGWDRLAEVTARLAEDLPSYETCPQCGEPLKTLKHEKQAELGCCPDR